MARIIYAEDDAMMAELVQTILIEAGHAVGTLGDGKSALDVVRRRRPDLLILDMRMPEMGGSEVLDVLRRDPDLWDLPVLVLTGRTSESDEAITRRAGATDYLRKPFKPEALVSAVEALLKQRKPPTEPGRRSI